MNRRAVFLDKDGTLVVNVPYNVDPSLIRLGPGAALGLSRLHAAGFLLIVVSNQSGVARGMFPEEALTPVHERLKELLADFGAPLCGFFYCPHHPRGTVARYAVSCSCRKPEPGMIEAAAREHGVSLADSWLVGDLLDDVEAGRRAGCRTVLLDNGHETIWHRSAIRQPDLLAADLEEAAQLILLHDGARKTFVSSPLGEES
jgi:D-glycero-D-manno-heptose 1,7-bisphosphate phosphatase